VPIRNFVIYQACLLDYHSDQALRPQLNATDYTLSEIRADCSAAIILRNEHRLSVQDVRMLPYMLDVEFPDTSVTGFSAKTERRMRNIMQCYFYNTSPENLTPKPRRG
jgi:hypothetical protein